MTKQRRVGVAGTGGGDGRHARNIHSQVGNARLTAAWISTPIEPRTLPTWRVLRYSPTGFVQVDLPERPALYE
jgi:hypothetical protein